MLHTKYTLTGITILPIIRELYIYLKHMKSPSSIALFFNTSAALLRAIFCQREDKGIKNGKIVNEGTVRNGHSEAHAQMDLRLPGATGARRQVGDGHTGNHGNRYR